MVAVQTGLRLSELTGLQRQDVALGTGAHVRCVGKGRKERCTPLAKTTVAVLKAWLCEQAGSKTEILFPSASGGRLSSDSVADLLAKHVAIACKSCPSLRAKHVTPHVLRHSMAMGLLQAGVDRAVIALWLGHESVETTQIYLEANLAMKEEILAKTTPPGWKAWSLSTRRRVARFPQQPLIRLRLFRTADPRGSPTSAIDGRSLVQFSSTPGIVRNPA